MQEQSGTQRRLCGEDLTGKEGYLVVLTHDTGVPEMLLPTDYSADRCLYAVKHGDVDGKLADFDPLDPNTIRTLKLKGTCNPGDELCLADEDTAADKGKVRTIPAAIAGDQTYMVHAVAEEAGVDGQLVRVRPVGVYPVVVPST